MLVTPTGNVTVSVNVIVPCAESVAVLTPSTGPAITAPFLLTSEMFVMFSASSPVA